MSKNLSTNLCRRLWRITVSYKGKISLYFDLSSLYYCHTRSLLLWALIRIAASRVSEKPQDIYQTCIWHNARFNISSQIYESPVFVGFMPKNLSTNRCHCLQKANISFQGEISLHFGIPSLCSCHIRPYHGTRCYGR